MIWEFWLTVCEAFWEVVVQWIEVLKGE